MIEPRNAINKELMTFLRDTTGVESVYNLMYMDTKPSEANGDRIDFMLDNFVANSQNYQIKRETRTELNKQSISEYRCQLKIRVVSSSPMRASTHINTIIGALRTRGYSEQYFQYLYIEGSTLRSRTIPFLDDGLISFIPEIIVDCYLGIEFNKNIDYFDKVEFGKIEIK